MKVSVVKSVLFHLLSKNKDFPLINATKLSINLQMFFIQRLKTYTAPLTAAAAAATTVPHTTPANMHNCTSPLTATGTKPTPQSPTVPEKLGIKDVKQLSINR